jgi:hypothetical protein
MQRKFPILGEVQDVEGSFWDVRDVRTTKYGFDLLFGAPLTRLGSYPGGLPRLIATKPLKDFWEANRGKRDGVIYDLPAGRTTLKRVRHRLGFNVLEDHSRFWKARLDDLRTLSAREFAARHHINIAVVFDTRRKLLGRTARDLGWWEEPSALEILQSGVTLREMGEELGISISQAKRLKDRALELHYRKAA